MARWNRAAGRLRLPPGASVLDLGCAFGFGTRLLTTRYRAFGHDLSSAYIDRAHRSVPGATFTHGPAHRVPYPDAFFAAILLLDVLEHVPDEGAVVDEIARLLAPGGQLVLSVPNRGALAAFDSLNLYHRWFAAGAPPTDDPSWPASPCHRHYSLAQLQSLLGPRFRVRSARYSGVGLAEPINLLLLIAFRAILDLPRLYAVLQYLYFGVYLLEDLLSTGPWGYHLMVDAERA